MPAPQPRPLSNKERELFQALQRLSEGRGALPELAEIEPGAFIWLVREAWREGARRDGRSGHLKDEEVAEKIAQAPGVEEFDRNRFQLQFGKGKRLASGKIYHQAITKPVAEAYLTIALNHWDISARSPKDRSQIWSLCTPFADLDRTYLDVCVKNAIGAMYRGDDAGAVYCLLPPGFGPKALYRDFGQQGSSVIVVGRPDAIRISDRESQILVLAELLNLQLDQGRGPAAKSLHIWAQEEPARSDPEKMIPLLGGIASLREMLGVVLEVEENADTDGDTAWKHVDLERCIIAIRECDGGKAAEAVFWPKTPETWVRQGLSSSPRDFIPVFARNPEGEQQFYSFSTGEDPTATPFIDVGDPRNGMAEELTSLHEAAKALHEGRQSSADTSGWKLYTLREFVGGSRRLEKRKMS